MEPRQAVLRAVRLSQTMDSWRDPPCRLFRGYGWSTRRQWRHTPEENPMTDSATFGRDWDYYKRLGVGRDANSQEIREAYKRQVQSLHPDRHPGPYQTHFQELAKGLNEARDTLLDPARRAAYDRELASQESRGSRGATSGDGWGHRPDPERVRRERAERERTQREQQERARKERAARERAEEERERERRAERERADRGRAERERSAREWAERERAKEEEERRERARAEAARGRAPEASSGIPLWLWAVLGFGLLIILLFLLSMGGSPEVARTAGWFGTEYRIAGKEGGATPNGARAGQVFVETGADSEEEFREIASEIASENPSLDLLVVEFYEGAREDTSGVLLDFDSPAGTEFVGNPGYSHTGGTEGDGVYMLEGQELERYPSGQGLFRRSG